MANIQVGNKVRILANANVKGHQWPNLKLLEAKQLLDKFGIVIPAMRALPDDEVFVKLDNGWTVIIQKRFLSN